MYNTYQDVTGLLLKSAKLAELPHDLTVIDVGLTQLGLQSLFELLHEDLGLGQDGLVASAWCSCRHTAERQWLRHRRERRAIASRSSRHTR
jgi:hypothetical protein